MSGYTQGPWSVGEVKNDDRYRPMNFTCPVHIGEGASRGNCIAIVYLGGDGGIVCTRDSVEANARRIVACVNACRHLTTEQLEAGDLDYAGCSALADIRTALEVGDKPMLDDLAGIVRTRMGVIKILERDAKGAQEALAQVTRERDEAVEALRPFAGLDMSPYEGARGERTFYQLNETEITVGDIRKARAVLAKIEGNKS